MSAQPDPKGPPDPTGPRYDEQGRRLCTAKRRGTGTLCNGPAMHGSNVCRIHGGLAPQTRAKARLRLLELVDPAIATLGEELTNKNAEVRLKAANSILDRTGHGRASKIEPVDARALLIERLLEIRAAAAEADPSTWVIEGHIIEPGENA